MSGTTLLSLAAMAVALTLATGLSVVVLTLPLAVINILVSHTNKHPACDLDDSVLGFSLSDYLFYQGVQQITFIILLGLISISGLFFVIKKDETSYSVSLALWCLLLFGNMACMLCWNLLGGVILFAEGWGCLTSVTGVGILASFNLSIAAILSFVGAWMLVQ